MTIADGITLEQTILGHALNSRECFDLFVADVDYTYFSVPNHRALAFCLKRMSTLGITKPDEDTFQLVLPGFPEEDKDYGGTEYIRQLRSAFVEPTDNYNQFVERLKVNAVKRSLATEKLSKIIAATNDPRATIGDIKALLNDIVCQVEEASAIGYNFLDMQSLGDEYLVEIDERAVRKFHTTGFPSLDEKLTEGFIPKKITVMAGFTGMAKSTVAVNMAHRVAVQGIGTAIFSMETTDVSLLDKVVSTLTQIPVTRLKKEAKDLSVEEIRRITNAIDSLRNLPILINDQASISIDGMLYQIQSARRRGYDPKVVFIDLFGKIEDVDTGDNLATRIQKEMKRMRVLAKSLDIHFVCIVQIGRTGFGRQRGNVIKRPTLIDIKNANAYAEEADLVFLLHRNKYYITDLEDDILEFDVAKQRDGIANTKVYFEIFTDTSTIVDTDKVPHDVIRGVA